MKSLRIGRRTAQAMRSNRPSQTTGKSKGIRPSPLDRYICRRNRSYKHPSYALVMEKLGERKVKGKAA